MHDFSYPGEILTLLVLDDPQMQCQAFLVISPGDMVNHVNHQACVDWNSNTVDFPTLKKLVVQKIYTTWYRQNRGHFLEKVLQFWILHPKTS